MNTLYAKAREKVTGSNEITPKYDLWVIWENQINLYTLVTNLEKEIEMKKLYVVLVALAIVASACQLGGAAQAEPTAIPLAATAVPSPTAIMNATAAPQGGGVPEAGTPRVSPSDGMTQIYVPDGTFMRGGIDADAHTNEMPSNKITMTGFWMDKVEVTNGMYMLCVTAGVCELPRSGQMTIMKSQTRENYLRDPQFTDYPVVYVTWGDADAYCKWSGRRLPSEAEWEYSARGGFPSLNTYPWGDQRPDGSYANFNYETGDTMRVGSFPAGASPFGILDLAGNVAEWVNDLYDMKYYDQSVAMNPTGPIAKSDEFMRVVRGGHWGDSWQMLRVSARASLMGPNPNVQQGTDRWYGESAPTVGFRCAAGN
jgi:formylglycine-generating enzyme required for sulfatase activity